MYNIYIKFYNKGFYMWSIIIEIIYHKFKYNISFFFLVRWKNGEIFYRRCTGLS